jgi:hypothetical protein
MTGQHELKKAWVTPKATRYGSVREITRDTKDKTFGAGDDVLIDDQAILADVGS